MKTRVSMRWVFLGLLVVFGFAMVPAVSAQPGTFVKGVLQPLADGFPKRPITLVVVDDPGSRDDLYAKVFQQASSSISPVPVLVADEPVASGGNFDKMLELKGRTGGKEGYFPMVISVFGPASDMLTAPIKEELGMDLDDMQYVILTETQEKVMVQRKNAPWGPTFDGMMKWGKANPGKLRYISREVGSGFDLVCEWMLQKAGVKVEKIPQGGHDQMVATVGSGQGDFTLTTAAAALTGWESGKVDINLVTGDRVGPPWDKDPNVTTSVKFGLPANVPLGTVMGWVVTKETPKSHVEWLFKLFEAVAKTGLYKNREKMIPQTTIKIIGPAESQALQLSAYKNFDPVVRSLGMHWEQQKK